jgi:hypothetical protein
MSTYRKYETTICEENSLRTCVETMNKGPLTYSEARDFYSNATEFRLTKQADLRQ